MVVVAVFFFSFDSVGVVDESSEGYASSVPLTLWSKRWQHDEPRTRSLELITIYSLNRIIILIIIIQWLNTHPLVGGTLLFLELANSSLALIKSTILAN